MDIQIETVLKQNITLVYDTLNLQALDTRALKELVGAHAPMIMDTPDMIVAVYPPEPIVIEIGDRRIRITLQQPAETIGSIPLWEIALRCHQLVPESKSTLVAYGYNYDLEVALAKGSTHEATINLFVSDPNRIMSALEGDLLSFVPRFRFQRDQTRYDLALEPIDDQHIKVHMNTHFGFEGITLPSQDQLQVAFREEYEYLVAMLPRLFAGGA